MLTLCLQNVEYSIKIKIFYAFDTDRFQRHWPAAIVLHFALVSILVHFTSSTFCFAKCKQLFFASNCFLQAIVFCKQKTRTPKWILASNRTFCQAVLHVKCSKIDLL